MTSRTSPRWSSAPTPGRAARCGSRRRWPTTPRAGCPCASCPTAAGAPWTAGPLRPRPLAAEQRDWYDAFWAASDVEVASDDPHHAAVQQAIRFNLFTLAQASGRADGHGVAAKGVTGSGYEGHYFWDTEVYVAPFLSYTRPELARNLMHFRSRMLPAARDRARELSQRGALFPWRTINGEEASAYYAAGTAQVHIDADVVHALVQYVNATGDVGFLVRDGLAILVETARLYADLGFWRSNGQRSFHIHGVTGPDEYTTVVNNNLFTNVMARYNLEQAVQWVQWAREQEPEEYARIAQSCTSPTARSPSGRPARRACTSPSTTVCRSTRRTTSSSTGRSGTSAAPPTSCGRSCSTTTRW